MKLNVIFVLRTITTTKLQGSHFYIIDINVSGNQGVKRAFLSWIGRAFKPRILELNLFTPIAS